MAAYCKRLGDGFAWQSIDGERCPYARLDGHHDVEVSGYVTHVNDGLDCVNVFLWHVPDFGRPDVAERLTGVMYVPNDPDTVRSVCDGLREHLAEAHEMGRTEVTWPRWQELGW